MEVLCVDNTNENKECPNPVLGDVYTVVDEKYFMGDEFYEFSEFITAGPYHFWYLKNRFIPLSSICETEFVRNYNTEKV